MPPVRSLPPPSANIKKRKNSTSAVAERIVILENELSAAIGSGTSLNALADLLDIATTIGEDAQVVSKTIYAIYRTVVLLVSAGHLTPGGDEDAKLVRTWIWERLNTFVDLLCGLLKDDDKTLRISALQILFSLLKHLSAVASSSPSTLNKPQPQFHTSHFKRIVSALLTCPASPRSHSKTKKQRLDADAVEDTRTAPDVRALFLDNWFTVHDDIRWFFLRESATLLSSPAHVAHPYLAENTLAIFERLDTFPTDSEELNAWWVEPLGVKPPKPKTSKGVDADEDADEIPSTTDADADDDWRKYFDEPSSDIKDSKKPHARLHTLTVHQSLHSLPSHRAVFTRAWLTLLPRLQRADAETENRPLSVRALTVLHRGVFPHLTRPVLVMDWVSECVDYGGAAGLLALNALFALIKEYNLDYPMFYTRLYAFLTRDVLHLRHRARFFRLAESFLSSTHLPAALLASFVKRLARLSLSAPPAGVVMLVPFTYNILKRHPALMVMIHRDGDSGIDPFDEKEPDPTKTRALESSLWELWAHERHYHAPVSTLTKVFSAPFTKPEYAMEDFLDHTYSTLFEAEARRKVRKEPAVEDETVKDKDLFPVTVLSPTSASGEQTSVTDVVAELWSFGF